MTGARTAMVTLTGALSLVLWGGSISVAEQPAGSAAEAIAGTARFPNSLCVVLGCGDGSLASGLARHGGYVVHALDPDAGQVQKARDALVAAGGYGLRVSVERGSPQSLPYADNLAKVLVVNAPVPATEVLRVVQPHGVVFLLSGLKAEDLEAAIKSAGLGEPTTSKGPGWIRIGLPVDPRYGEWPHSDGDADQNNFTDDRMLKPPFRMKWAGDSPPWGLSRCVSSNGRIFSDARLASMEPEQDARYGLIARDAYSGLLLWERESDCPCFELIAAGDMVIAGVVQKPQGTAAVEVFDAATGRLLATYKSPSPKRLAYQDGILYGADRGGISAVKALTGEPLWRIPSTGASFAVGKSALFHTPQGGGIAAVDRGTGEERWLNKEVTPDGARISCHDDKVLVANVKANSWASVEKANVLILSAADGRIIWSRELNLSRMGRRYWASAIMAEDRVFSGAGIFALATGEPLPRMDYPGGRGGGTCARGPVAAASGWVYSGRIARMLNWKTGQAATIGPLRGACHMPVIPGHGQLCFTPKNCECFPLTDWVALAPAGDWVPDKGPSPASRLEKGPAYGTTGRLKAGPDDWPRFRHDNGHSAASRGGVSLPMKQMWRSKLEGRLTQPAVVGGKVFVGSDAHRVWRLDAGSGDIDWSYVTDGAVTVTPTIHDGLVLFGSYDGWVYCLNADSGELCWRFPAAPEEHKIVIRDKLSSSWPVESGVLVKDGVAFAAAGWYGPDGMCYYGLNPGTGEVLWAEKDNTQSWHGGGVAAANEGYILSPVGDSVRDPKTGRKIGRLGGGRNRGVQHVARAGRWAIFGSEDPGANTRGEGLLWPVGPKSSAPALSGFFDHDQEPKQYLGLRGTELIFTANRLYALKWFPSTEEQAERKKALEEAFEATDPKDRWGKFRAGSADSAWRLSRTIGARAFVEELSTKPQLIAYSCDAAADDLLGSLKELWRTPVEAYRAYKAFNAMILTGDTLLAANPGAKKLVAISTEDGTKLGEYAVPDAPVRDGLAAAQGRLYVALEGGSLLCLGK